MSAPDLETIYDQESAIEEALKKVFASIGLRAFGQRDTDDLTDDRIDIQVALGAVQGHRSQVRPGFFAYDTWQAQIAIDVWTLRRAETDPAYQVNAHRLTRAKVRRAIQYYEGRFTADLLPYHTLTKITEAGTTPEIDIEGDADASRLIFDCVVAVRTGAWPA